MARANTEIESCGRGRAVGREHEIRLRLDGDELALLDEQRPRGATRPAYLRSLLREGQKPAEIASRDEALAILTSLARDGRVSAAIALERALREGEDPREGDELSKFDELARSRGPR